MSERPAIWVFRQDKRARWNMQAEDITKHLARSGFQRAIVNGPYVDVLIQAREKEAYVITVLDCKCLKDLTVENYERILRGIRSSIYQYDLGEVKFLSVLCTEEPDTVKELVAGFGEHWVADLKEHRLLIYENQVLKFANAKEVIEEALLYQDMAGEVREVQQKRSFFRESICNWFIIAVNILIFILVELSGSSEDVAHMIDWGAMLPSEVGHGFWQYRLFTSMFLHFGIDHLLNNMLVLAVMGKYLERHVGKGKYLFIYLIAGLVGNIVSLYLNIYQHTLNVVSAGASGAIFGVIGAILCIVIKNYGRIEDLSLSQVAFMILLSIYTGVTSQGVDNGAHIGGLIAGFVLAAVLYRRSDKEEQVS